jgi:HK97 family phage prohead protease
VTPSLLHHRAAGLPPELRDGRRLVCYFAVFDRVSTHVVAEHGRRFREVIRRGAFSKSLAAGRPVYACVEHDRATAFAFRPGSLHLEEDERGLFGSVYLGTSAAEERALRGVASGELASCSVGFFAAATTAAGADGLPLDTVAEADLFDVTLTREGVYSQTEAGLRSAAAKGCPADPLAERLRILKCRR